MLTFYEVLGTVKLLLICTGLDKDCPSFLEDTLSIDILIYTKQKFRINFVEQPFRTDDIVHNIELYRRVRLGEFCKRVNPNPNMHLFVNIIKLHSFCRILDLTQLSCFWNICLSFKQYFKKEDMRSSLHFNLYVSRICICLIELL